MKVVVALLFFGLSALASESAEKEQTKPMVIQDGSAAQSYIHSALSEYLEKPPYLAIQAETPFFAKRLDGKSMWIALVEFYCGASADTKVHCMTIIVYDPANQTHRFMKPDEVVQESESDPDANTI
jgi:hypothetical protein